MGNPYARQRRVSIRAPARGATCRALLASEAVKFRSAPPHGGRRLSWSGDVETCAFRSAPPHGGRRVLADFVNAMRFVSIRAPARGATAMGFMHMLGNGVSIRAPARGAT